MNYKVEKVLKDSKKYIIVFLILWLVIDIVLIAPIAVSIASATNDGKVSMEIFFDNFFKELTSFTSIFKASTNFTQLSDELSGTENRIAVARRDYYEEKIF